MYRIVITIAIFIMAIPFVWRVVNRLLNRVESEMKSPKLDADKINAQKQSFIDECIRKREKLKKDMKNADAAISSLKTKR